MSISPDTDPRLRIINGELIEQQQKRLGEVILQSILDEAHKFSDPSAAGGTQTNEPKYVHIPTEVISNGRNIGIDCAYESYSAKNNSVDTFLRDIISSANRAHAFMDREVGNNADSARVVFLAGSVWSPAVAPQEAEVIFQAHQAMRELKEKKAHASFLENREPSTVESPIIVSLDEQTMAFLESLTTPLRLLGIHLVSTSTLAKGMEKRKDLERLTGALARKVLSIAE